MMKRPKMKKIDPGSYQGWMVAYRSGRTPPIEVLFRLTTVALGDRILGLRYWTESVVEVLPNVVWLKEGEVLRVLGYNPVRWQCADDFYQWADSFMGSIFSLGDFLKQYLKEDASGRNAILTKHEQKIARAEKVRNLREQGMTQQAIADELGVSRRTVNSDMCAEKSVQTQKTAQPRKVTQYTVTQYTKPETAAEKIHAKFGPEFAHALKEAL